MFSVPMIRGANSRGKVVWMKPIIDRPISSEILFLSLNFASNEYIIALVDPKLDPH